MAKSFLLKGSDGRIGGYLQQQHDMVRCRLMDKAAAMLILYDEYEEAARFDLPPGGGEQCFACGRRISGAVVSRGEKMLLCTDDVAVRMFERMRRKTTDCDSQRPSVNCSNEIETENEKDKPALQMQPTEVTSWPQSRWPPPACWPAAAYVRGRWQECETETSGTE